MSAKEFWEKEIKGIGSRKPLVYDLAKFQEWTTTRRKGLLKEATEQIQRLNRAVVKCAGKEEGGGDVAEFEAEQSYMKSREWKLEPRHTDEKGDLVRNWVTDFHYGKCGNAGRVDVNHATAKELMDNLLGVGPETARKIVEAREKKSSGSFETYDELFEAMGHKRGDKTSDGVLPFVRLGQGEDDSP